MNLKKIIALALVLTMCLSLIPTYAFADDEIIIEDGFDVIEEAEEIAEIEEPEEIVVEAAEEPTEEVADPVDDGVVAVTGSEETTEEAAEEQQADEAQALSVSDTAAFNAGVTVHDAAELYTVLEDDADRYDTTVTLFNDAEVSDTIVLDLGTDSIELGPYGYSLSNPNGTVLWLKSGTLITGYGTFKSGDGEVPVIRVSEGATLVITYDLYCNGGDPGISVDGPNANVYAVVDAWGDPFYKGSVTSGYEWEKSTYTYEDDTCQQLVKPMYAQIGDTKYETVQAAFDAAQDGDTVTLLRDTAGAAINSAKSITLDLAGYTMTKMDGGGDALYVGNGGTVNITGTSGGRIEAGSGNNEYAINVGNGGKVFLNDSNLTVIGTLYFGMGASKNNISVTAGKFSVNPESYVPGTHTVITDSDNMFVIVPAVASVNGVGYTTLQNAINAGLGDYTITLLQDIELTETVVAKQLDYKAGITLDLNGHDITATGCRALWIRDCIVKIYGDGTISASGNNVDAVIHVGDTETNDEPAGLTIGDDSEESKTVTQVTGNGCCAVSAFGTNDVISITVNQNAVVTTNNPDAYAIYFNPNNGNLDVMGTVNGGIETKSGTTFIYPGASITGRKSPSYVGPNENGPSTKGYAIAAVDNGGNTENPPSVNIDDYGTESITIKGEVAAYAEKSAKQIGTVSASFNTIPIPAGFEWEYDSEYENYTLVKAAPPGAVKIGDTWYDTLQEAVEAAQIGDTIVLQDDITEGDIEIRKDLTVDLNGHTLTIDEDADAAFNVSKKNVTFTLKDSADGGKIVSDSSSVYAVEMTGNGAAFVMDGGSIELTGANSSGVDVTRTGTVTINGGSIDVTAKAIANNSDAVINVTGGTLKGNIAVYNLSGNVNISGGTLNGTTYAVQMADGGATKISGSPALTGALYANAAELISITGGTYSLDPSTYVAEGKISWPTDDGFEILPAVTVTFDADGGKLEGESSFQLAEGKSLNDAATVKGYTYPTTTKTGYGFNGWYDGETELDLDAAVAANVTYKAQWADAVARIDTNYYASLAEAVAAAEPYQTVVLMRNAEITEPVVVDKTITIDLNANTLTNNGTGYALNITAGNVQIQKGTIAGSGKGITATGSSTVVSLGSESVPSYTLAVDVAGCALDLHDGATAALVAGSALKTSAAGEAAVFADANTAFNMNGGTVSGTMTINNGKTKFITGGYFSEIPEADWIVDGKACTGEKNAEGYYEVVDAVTVTFNANEGTGEMAAQKIGKSSPTELSENTFTRTGYAFNGWNTAEDGSGTAYADKAKVTLTQDITLYAQWTEYVTIETTLDMRDFIGIRVYIANNKADASFDDYTITASYKGETILNNEPVSEGGARTRGGVDTRWFYVAKVDSIDMAEPVEVKLFYQGKPVTEFTTSVQDYCEEKIPTVSGPQRDLLIGLLDFGRYAQKHFPGLVGTLMHSEPTAGEAVINATAIPEYTVTIENNEKSGISGGSIALVLNAATAMNVYFAPTDANAKISNYRFYVDGVRVGGTAVDGQFLVTVDDIRSNELFGTHTVTAYNRATKQSFSLTAAPAAYLYQVRDTEGTLSPLAKAMYRFGDAAVNAFSN